MKREVCIVVCIYRDLHEKGSDTMLKLAEDNKHTEFIIKDKLQTKYLVSHSWKNEKNDQEEFESRLNTKKSNCLKLL